MPFPWSFPQSINRITGDFSGRPKYKAVHIFFLEACPDYLFKKLSACKLLAPSKWRHALWGRGGEGRGWDRDEGGKGREVRRVEREEGGEGRGGGREEREGRGGDKGEGMEGEVVSVPSSNSVEFVYITHITFIHTACTVQYWLFRIRSGVDYCNFCGGQ